MCWVYCENPAMWNEIVKKNCNKIILKVISSEKISVRIEINFWVFGEFAGSVSNLENGKGYWKYFKKKDVGKI